MIPPREAVLAEGSRVADPQDLAARINELIAKLQDELHTTSIVVTHDIDAVDGLCDQLVVLRRGRVIAQREGKKLRTQEILDAYHAVV